MKYRSSERTTGTANDRVQKKLFFYPYVERKESIILHEHLFVVNANDYSEYHKAT